MSGDYKFMITAVDGEDNPDRLRVKIWDEATDVILYDNKMGDDNDAELDDSTIIGGGSIIVHKAR